MNILIINQPPFNRGDESAHKALLRTLIQRLPSANIRVFYEEENTESMRQYAVHNERISYIKIPRHYLKSQLLVTKGLFKNRRWLWKLHPFFRTYHYIYNWADIVVCAPGGICMGGFQSWYHLFFLLLTKFYKKPLAYYGRSFGPFPIETESNRLFKKLSLEMLNYFSFLSIRDHKTELLAEELNIPYISTVDTAFLDLPEVEIPYELKSLIGEKPYVVFVPNYLLWHYAYKGKVSHEQIMTFYSKVIDELIAAHPCCNIVMLPQLFCGREYALSDIDFFRDLAQMKNDDRIIVIPDCYSSDIQQTIIHGANVLLGSRYHSIVFAINQNVPFIALSYEHKIVGLLETLGKQDCCVDITNTFLNDDIENTTIKEIRQLLRIIGKDTEAQQKAKTIAHQCMDSFISNMCKQ